MEDVRVGSIEMVYRGVLQKRLAQRICEALVLGARKQGKRGIVFGRYGDSPERVGIPAKQFAVICDSDEQLQFFMTKYEPENTDVSVVLDDTLCKGIESWAWHGLQPINKLTRTWGTVLVVSMTSPEHLLSFIRQKGDGYNLAVLKGHASFSTMWVYNDDNSEARLIGALARVVPDLVDFDSIEQVLLERQGQTEKVTAAREAFAQVEIRQVIAQEGNDKISGKEEFPSWHQMTEALVIPALPRGDLVGREGYRPQRNPHFRTFSLRSRRPVIDFSRCRRCRLCWLHCPDSSFDLMPDGLCDADMDYCNGCGICAAVCPVAGCVTMVPESMFTDNGSQWQRWQSDRESYGRWIKGMVDEALPTSHRSGARIQAET